MTTLRLKIIHPHHPVTLIPIDYDLEGDLQPTADLPAWVVEVDVFFALHAVEMGALEYHADPCRYEVVKAGATKLPPAWADSEADDIPFAVQLLH